MDGRPWRPLGIGAVAVAAVIGIGLLGARTSAARDVGHHQVVPLAQVTSVDWSAVEQAMGKTGTAQPGDVYKFSLPRSDLQVTARGVPLQAGLALGSWVAFKPTADGAMAMGDLVLTEDEVSPVMLRLQERGIAPTALHNHVLGESPRVMYLHIAGHGDAVQLAAAVHAALAATGTPFAASAAPAAALPLDTAQLDATLGARGNAAGSVYQFSIPRRERIVDSGTDVPPAMGTATAINFQPTDAGDAAATGDFVLLASEVTPVLRALRANGIEVTALHSHMLAEEPRLYFAHFWATDDALRIARGLRAALDLTNSGAAGS